MMEDFVENSNYRPFLKYEDGSIAGVCDFKKKIFGMMPHPERNNYDFKYLLLDMLLNNPAITSQFVFDKCIKDLMFSEHISYKTTKRFLKKITHKRRLGCSRTRRKRRYSKYWKFS